MVRGWLRWAIARRAGTDGPATHSPRAWRALVPVVCLVAGTGFAVSSHQAHDARAQSPTTAGLAGLVRSAGVQVRAETEALTALQRQVSAQTEREGRSNGAVARAQTAAAALRGPGGLRAVAGPGMTVILDDAEPSEQNAGVDPNQLLIHQSDLQAVVNALWAGGAEAMTIAGQRVIATSAVRCVGNTLLLNGQVFSPPYRIKAIGPFSGMSHALDGAPGVQVFAQAASYYGLGYTVERSARLHLPGYAGPVGLVYAKPVTK